jgi:hypothetical protein
VGLPETGDWYISSSGSVVGLGKSSSGQPYMPATLVFNDTLVHLRLIQLRQCVLAGLAERWRSLGVDTDRPDQDQMGVHDQVGDEVLPERPVVLEPLNRRCSLSMRRAKQG